MEDVVVGPGVVEADVVTGLVVTVLVVLGEDVAVIGVPLVDDTVLPVGQVISGHVTAGQVGSGHVTVPMGLVTVGQVGSGQVTDGHVAGGREVGQSWHAGQVVPVPVGQEVGSGQTGQGVLVGPRVDKVVERMVAPEAVLVEEGLEQSQGPEVVVVVGQTTGGGHVPSGAREDWVGQLVVGQGWQVDRETVGQGSQVIELLVGQIVGGGQASLVTGEVVGQVEAGQGSQVAEVVGQVMGGGQVVGSSVGEGQVDGVGGEGPVLLRSVLGSLQNCMESTKTERFTSKYNAKLTIYSWIDCGGRVVEPFRSHRGYIVKTTDNCRLTRHRCRCVGYDHVLLAPSKLDDTFS